MPFSLCNAPATFQWAVQLVFWGMTWKEILTYLDDLNVIGNGFCDHLQNLRKSFQHLHKYQLKLKPHSVACSKQRYHSWAGWSAIKGLLLTLTKLRLFQNGQSPRVGRMWRHSWVLLTTIGITLKNIPISLLVCMGSLDQRVHLIGWQSTRLPLKV